MLVVFIDDDGDLVTQVKCPKSYKSYFTVIKKVKKAHEINDYGENQVRLFSSFYLFIFFFPKYFADSINRFLRFFQPFIVVELFIGLIRKNS